MITNMVDTVKAISALEDVELTSKINKKVTELIETVDLNEVQKDPMFKKMLCAALAAKATGTAFNGTV